LKEKSEANKGGKNAGDEESDWESVEEDYQHIQPDELKSLED